jgi:hypothetical protein
MLAASDTTALSRQNHANLSAPMRTGVAVGRAPLAATSGVTLGAGTSLRPSVPWSWQVGRWGARRWGGEVADCGWCTLELSSLVKGCFPAGESFTNCAAHR